MINNTNTIGFTPETLKNLLIDAGACYINYGLPNEAPLCATSGGNEFIIKVNSRNVVCDGLKGSVKGLTRITSTDVTLLVNMLEITTLILKMALMADVDSTTNVGYDTITGTTTISITDYIDNIAIVGEISGSSLPIVIIVKNALSLDGFQFKAKDNADNILPVTFTGNIDPNNPQISPYEIRYPQADALSQIYMITSPIISEGKVRLDFSDDVEAVIPIVGFGVTVAGVADVITAITRDINDLSVVYLTLTAEPTAGQSVTVDYTIPTVIGNQVTSLNGGTLTSFTDTPVVNN